MCQSLWILCKQLALLECCRYIFQLAYVKMRERGTESEVQRKTQEALQKYVLQRPNVSSIQVAAIWIDSSADQCIVHLKIEFFFSYENRARE